MVPCIGGFFIVITLNGLCWFELWKPCLKYRRTLQKACMVAVEHFLVRGDKFFSKPHLVTENTKPPMFNGPGSCYLKHGEFYPKH